MDMLDTSVSDDAFVQVRAVGFFSIHDSSFGIPKLRMHSDQFQKMGWSLRDRIRGELDLDSRKGRVHRVVSGGVEIHIEKKDRPDNSPIRFNLTGIDKFGPGFGEGRQVNIVLTDPDTLEWNFPTDVQIRKLVRGESTYYKNMSDVPLDVEESVRVMNTNPFPEEYEDERELRHEEDAGRVLSLLNRFLERNPNYRTSIREGQIVITVTTTKEL